MLVSLKSWLSGSVQLISLLAILLVSASVALGQAQSNAADLQGTVKDSTGASVINAQRVQAFQRLRIGFA